MLYSDMYFELELALALLYLILLLNCFKKNVNRDQSSLNRYVHLCKYP